MKNNCLLFLGIALSTLYGCATKQSDTPIQGTWELVSATATEKDSTYSTFDPKRKMIKILNPTHFAFLNHDISGQNDSSATRFSAGGGKYTFTDSTYTEYLDYYSDKAWENNKFEFVVKLSGDTLVQKGVEKVEKLGIDRVIVETYKRVTN
ncbi:hypothetical protein M0L20_15875 [Spirosoma sp. RP8]|uniref:Lipocalin-like domain-containing protein n=1 Tax=Spirosoma liriopis TaxID=2937440 RepID=A0ABT0HME3_9BACT|nr:hypothetical protein [Spirosoma liriopis]MCK8493346.1 hypothetical protein [Spirosoma liriopis]